MTGGSEASSPKGKRMVLAVVISAPGQSGKERRAAVPLHRSLRCRQGGGHVSHTGSGHHHVEGFGEAVHTQHA